MSKESILLGIKAMYKEISKLKDQIEAKDKELGLLRKQNSIGEINEAYAKTIEADKETISKQAITINKLRQKNDKLTARNKELEDEILELKSG